MAAKGAEEAGPPPRGEKFENTSCNAVSTRKHSVVPRLLAFGAFCCCLCGLWLREVAVVLITVVAVVAIAVDIYMYAEAMICAVLAAWLQVVLDFAVRGVFPASFRRLLCCRRGPFMSRT